MPDRWATFDCYGTLVDWNAGIRAALASLWPEADPQSLLRAYHDAEPAVQAADPHATYRRVMAESAVRVGNRHGMDVPAGREDTLAESLPAWPVFAEVGSALRQLRDRGWRLAILSNTDPDLLAGSIASIGVDVDTTVTAADSGAYKPAHAHWLTFFETTRAARGLHVHVAQSLFHDVAPAIELGLRSVWINRLGEATALRPDAELADLTGLADTLDGIVAA